MKTIVLYYRAKMNRTLLPLIRFLVFLSLTLLGGLQVAQAQFRVQIQGVGLTQRPIAIAPFAGRDQISTPVDSIIMADLERSGMFRRVEISGLQLSENSLPDFAALGPSGADAIVTGSIQKMEDGRWDIRYRLWDVVAKQDLGGFSFPVTNASLRIGAHQVADSVYEKLTGEKGVFTTRIGYVTKNNNQYNLWVADSDGQGASSALSSSQPIISPTWSPDGNRLAYVSFESGKPTIFVHTISTGQRRLVSNFKGSNSAPAWSPDGKQLIATLTLSGHSQLYLLDLASGKPKRISDSNSIDTEPAWSPDGVWIYFVSDRGGAPHVYRMPASGGSAERITLNGNYNTSPAVSPNGQHLAFVTRENNQYKLMVMDLSTRQTRYLTDTIEDERPSFSANGRMIVYATKVAGKEALMVTTLDGRVRSRLTGERGDIREPSWGPFR